MSIFRRDFRQNVVFPGRFPAPDPRSPTPDPWPLAPGPRPPEAAMISEELSWKIHNSSRRDTQAQIALRLGVSHSTVGRVLRGAWHPRRFRPREASRLLALWAVVLSRQPRPASGRCRGCGSAVALPCVACLAGVLRRLGIRAPAKAVGGACVCGGNFSRSGPAPRRPLRRRPTLAEVLG